MYTVKQNPEKAPQNAARGGKRPPKPRRRKGALSHLFYICKGLYIMLRFFMDRPFKVKIIILTLLSSILLVAVLALFFYSVYYHNVVEEARNYEAQNMIFVKDNIEDIQDNIANLSTILFYSPSFQQQISPEEKKLSPEAAADAMYSVNMLTNSIISNNYVSFISIAADNGYSFYYASNGLTEPTPLKKAKTDAAYRQMVGMLGEPDWISVPQSGGNFMTNNQDAKLTMLRSLIDIDSKQPQGLMTVCVNWNSIWSAMSMPSEYAYLIVDGSGRIVSSSTDLESLRTFQSGQLFPVAKLPASSSGNASIVSIGGRKYLLSSGLIYQSGLYVVCLRPMSIILRNIDRFNIVLTLVVGICLVVSLLLATLLSTIVTKPLNKLVKAINLAAKGDFGQRVNFVYADELGVLGRSFDKMAGQLNTLFNKVLKLELKNREAELKSLQAQINPHFLYNTLDSIYVKAMRSNNKELADMVYALSRIFRLSLNLGNTMTQVHSEKEFIENYILLQKIRLKERLVFRLTMDEQILPKFMPKLILQPFVENAIVHAAEVQAGATEIDVNGFYSDNSIWFTVQDNGAGISEEVLHQLNSAVGDRKGYALRNIRERLELCYGHDYTLNIESTPGMGTRVLIRIPDKPTETEEE